MMNNKYSIENILNKLDRQEHSTEERISLKKNDFYLTEEDFYPPYDDRVLESYVEDIEGGDNFADYCKDIFELLEEEEYYEE